MIRHGETLRRTKEEINELIAVRKQAGIHSQSQVLEEESGQYKYHATIQGHRGKVIVRVGKFRSTTVPEGYELAVEGGDRGQYTVYIKVQGEDIQNTKEEVQRTKVLKDGQLYIRVGEHMYDARGNRVE